MDEYPHSYTIGITSYRFREGSGENAEREKFVKFSPRLSLQRYCAVVDCLYQDDIRIITEYGPNNCHFLYSTLQGTSWLEHVNLVDVNAEIIRSSYWSLREPRCNRTQRERIRKLEAVFYHGNIACRDHRVSNSDAVVGIELIEHMTAADFDAFPENVFGYIQPKYAVFTTPNREFNVLFNRLEHEFRHPDHKFEFNRAECRAWAEKIVRTYPSYSFKIYGIGAPPEGAGDVGFASQIVIFRRMSEPAPILSLESRTPRESYTLIGEILFHCGDNRTSEEKRLCELAYTVDSLLGDLTFDHSTVYMRRERCAEGHFMDVVPVTMVVKHLEEHGFRTDVDTVLMAEREFSPVKYETETTIAFGPVFIDKRDCDGSFHDENPDLKEPSPFFYALPSLDLSTNDSWANKGEIRHYVEQFLEAAANEREFLLAATRETCAFKHSMRFLTPEIVVAHLKVGGVETNSKTVLQLWEEVEMKYPLEDTSFGRVILIEKYCGDSPCEPHSEESVDDERCSVDSPCLSDLENIVKSDDECYVDAVEDE